jgi:hypothetical protein
MEKADDISQGTNYLVDRATDRNVIERKVLIEKIAPAIKLIRVIDFDGMGGKEYLYHCGNCKREIGQVHHCKWCDTFLDGIEKRDSWGI